MTKIPHFPTRLTILKIGMIFKKIQLAVRKCIHHGIYLSIQKNKSWCSTEIQYLCSWVYQKRETKREKKLFDDIIFELILFAKNL